MDHFLTRKESSVKGCGLPEDRRRALGELGVRKWKGWREMVGKWLGECGVYGLRYLSLY